MTLARHAWLEQALAGSGVELCPTSGVVEAGRLGDGFYPYVISPEDYADRVATIRATAIEHNRDPDTIEMTVWPGSYQRGGSFDLGLIEKYAESGLDRLIVSAAESGSADIDDIRRFVARYHTEVLDKIGG